MSSLSVDEVIGTVRRSSLPTVITEGKDDYFIYRRVEAMVSDSGASFLPVGGRGTVIEIFRRRAEMAGGKVAFIIDLDMWALSGPPEEFVSPWVATTFGYSIENDLYIDGEFERLLHGEEVRRFKRDLSQLCNWFAREVDIYNQGQPHLVDRHVDRILDRGGNILADIEADRLVSTRSATTYEKVCASYQQLIRGKTLLSLLLRQLSYQGRGARHNDRSLMEVAAIADGALMRALAGRVRQALAEPMVP
ncbi:MAG: DUF4435 domain-containing protein [Brevundimonas sp.]|jgi:hypothetical protein|uniref:hypothetical protein n=1 Tax=Brevundimonas sp. TaxID=1871086 RepID=UPI0025C44E08|nr:hypothetical protein [Brevundimonas sp.]MCH4267971.1 DUF4435 domain-containing protein [Brevundimonas sp.]